MPALPDLPRAAVATKASPARRNRWPFIGLAAILAVAAFLRLFHIMSLFPILIDESIYLRWTEIIVHQGQWFVSLLDAKQPLSYWIYALVRMAAPGMDPLLGPRLVSVCAGLGSTALLFRLGRRFSGEIAGFIAAFLYAVMPFGVLYDRLAYTDALVNLCGIATTVASMEYFAASSPGTGGALQLGLLLGAGFSVKSTFALLLWVPLLAAVLLGRHRRRLTVIRLLQIYGTAVILPALSFLCVPNAPMFQVNNLLVHHTNFFPPAAFLLAHPFVNFPENGRLVWQYANCYVTLPVACAGMVSAIYLVARRRREAMLLSLAIAVPLLTEILLLWFLHSRYVFAFVWPIVALTALALGDLRRRSVALALTAAIAAPALMASCVMLRNPRNQLHAIEVDEFLSSGPYSGYGIAEAVAYLKKESGAMPVTVLTDPLFGTPADAIHAYLNLWRGDRVYDAWWLQLSARQPILPAGLTEVMKSQYERVSAGAVDFSRLTRVYYVTDTNYNKPAAVLKRDPGVRLEARFVKNNGLDYVDVYRLR
jgi:4-amino-4-deoxy-L-arabinose transferase-like glycosyltransferase